MAHRDGMTHGNAKHADQAGWPPVTLTHVGAGGMLAIALRRSGRQYGSIACPDRQIPPPRVSMPGMRPA